MENEHRLNGIKLMVKQGAMTKDEAIEQVAKTAGRSALEEDLAAFPEKVEQYYNAAQRDRLIANIRQEMAEMAVLVPSLCKVVLQTRTSLIHMQKTIYLLAGLNIISLLVIVWTIRT